MPNQDDKQSSSGGGHSDPGHTKGKAEGDEKTVDQALQNQSDNQNQNKKDNNSGR